MRRLLSVRSRGMVVGLAALFCVKPATGQWAPPQRLSEAGSPSTHWKLARLAASREGGFHAVYMQQAYEGVKYRRYRNGALSPVRTLYSGFCADATVAEALNGDVHVAFERGGPGDALYIAWMKSTDGGSTWPVSVQISTWGESKHPLLSPLGLGTGDDMLLSYFRANGGNNIACFIYNGSTWSGEAWVAAGISGYDCFDQAWSPLDGSVWRTYGSPSSPLSYRLRQYTTAWQPEIVLQADTWPVREHIAVNDAGQVMAVYEDWTSDMVRVRTVRAALYTPGAGVQLMDMGPPGYNGAVDVCSIPGTSDFYFVKARAGEVRGQRWHNGAWGASELISGSMSSELMPDPSVTADATGAVFCAWEHWVGTNLDYPEQWFAIRPAQPFISVSPSSVAQTAWVGQSPPPGSFTLSNIGAGNMSYSLSDDAAWLSVVNPSGTLGPGQSTTISLACDTASLNAGTWHADVTVSAPSAMNHPQVVPVTLTVITVRPDLDGDGDVDQKDFGAFQVCYSGAYVQQPDPACQPALLDIDDDVDQDDAGILLGCMHGADVLAPHDCAP